MIKPRMTSLNPKIIDTQNTVKELQQKVLDQTKDSSSIGNVPESFVNSLSKAIENVSENQMKSAELTKNFELGIENDLTKVMIQQQLAGLGFQMTLNVRNKVLSAYKDIMNMPV
jgi:flagellar hook-basal body complex protein FliE